MTFARKRRTADTRLRVAGVSDDFQHDGSIPAIVRRHANSVVASCVIRVTNLLCRVPSGG